MIQIRAKFVILYLTRRTAIEIDYYCSAIVYMALLVITALANHLTVYKMQRQLTLENRK
jgi:hypothetical protein